MVATNHLISEKGAAIRVKVLRRRLPQQVPTTVQGSLLPADGTYHPACEIGRRQHRKRSLTMRSLYSRCDPDRIGWWTPFFKIVL